MATYQTIDYLPDLTASEMTNARNLVFLPYTDSVNGATGWDNKAEASGSESYALLHGYYSFHATEGATYDIFTISFFDPFILRIYDQYGNTIVANNESDDLPLALNGTTYETDIIWEWVAPYTGTYYLDASWDQGSYYTYYSINVYEDVDTIPAPPPPVIAEPVQEQKPAENSIDRIFNWGESVHTDLFPEHQESKPDVFGYYARMYSNGDALGEKLGNIYYYDGGADGTGEIYLVGTTSDFMPQATAAGF